MRPTLLPGVVLSASTTGNEPGRSPLAPSLPVDVCAIGVATTSTGEQWFSFVRPLRSSAQTPVTIRRHISGGHIWANFERASPCQDPDSSPCSLWLHSRPSNGFKRCSEVAHNSVTLRILLSFRVLESHCTLGKHYPAHHPCVPQRLVRW